MDIKKVKMLDLKERYTKKELKLLAFVFEKALELYNGNFRTVEISRKEFVEILDIDTEPFEGIWSEIDDKNLTAKEKKLKHKWFAPLGCEYLEGINEKGVKYIDWQYFDNVDEGLVALSHWFKNIEYCDKKDVIKIKIDPWVIRIILTEFHKSLIEE